MTKTELLAKLKALGDISEEQRNKIVCSLIGHSKIVTTCFGYVYCSRCEAQIGDTLLGVTTLEGNVIVGHDCEACRSNYATLGWKDKLYTPGPFKKDEA